MEEEIIHFDCLVIGSGSSGLFSALKLAEKGFSVAVVTKRSVNESNTRHAQGGVACVIDRSDSFAEHVNDTLVAGDNLCKREVVEEIVESAPKAISDLEKYGLHFTTRGEIGEKDHFEDYDLGKEGGHSKRRVLHAGDFTGEQIEDTLVSACKQNDKIKIFENHIAVDLITTAKLGWMGEDFILGAYVLDIACGRIKTFTAISTVVATGGAGKIYLYSSNPDIASGDGIAMCYRAHVPILNMEFFQFHPTILYHQKEKSFLISEALRGEGARLLKRDSSGQMIEFMENYHHLGALAPRDVVARAIDNELKRSGQESVFLDITRKNRDFLQLRFPKIFEKLFSLGIDMSKDLIPVVPAAHYSCGGIQTSVNGTTSVKGLYVVGESACTGLHGANRLASNSLLEAIVVPKTAAKNISASFNLLKKNRPSGKIPVWRSGNATNSDELVVVSHNWEEIRKFMWDYVGIFRTNKRLERAKNRIKNIRKEIEKYYWDFYLSPDLIELRNLASVAEIIIDSAITRKESRGLHYNADYPDRDPDLDGIDTVIRKPYR
jgi:L-aspartate oxidase